MHLLALLSSTAFAQVACGDTLTSSVTLTADLDCTGVAGDILSIGADGVTLDGAGFTITADVADAVIRNSGFDDMIVRDLVLDGAVGTGNGVELVNTDNATVENVMANGRNRGVSAEGLNPGLTITDTDVSDSVSWGMFLSNVDDGLVMARNIFDGSTEGLRISGLTGPWTFPTGAGIDSSFIGVAETGPNDDALFLTNVNGVTVSNLSLSSASGTGRGIVVSGSDDVALIQNNVSGRATGILVTGAGSSGFTVNSNDASESTVFGIRLEGVTLPLTLESNVLDNSDQGIRIDDLVGPWTLPSSNSFSGVPGSANDDVWELHDVSNIQIGGTLFGTTGQGNAFRLINTTDVTIDSAFVFDFYRGVYATGTTTGLTVSNSFFINMSLRGLQLKGVDAATSLSNINLTDSANGVLLDQLVGPQTYDFATFDFTGVGLGATTREYVEVRDSSDVTIENITGLDLDNDVRVVRVDNSTNTLIDNLQTCVARRGVDLVGATGTIVQNSAFGNGRDGVVVDASSTNTDITAAFLGNLGSDVVDNGVNTTINASTMADADLDGLADLCDDCPNDALNDLDGDGLCADIDDDDDGDGVLDINDGDPNDPNACEDSDGDSCDDCAVAAMSEPNNDGTDTDGDGACDAGDTDDDNDGRDDVDDSSPLDPNICADTDFDGCDDCSTGTFDITNDGTDSDGDGVCDTKDLFVEPSMSFDTSDVPWTTGGVGSPSVVWDDSAGGRFVMVFETQLGTHPDCPVGVWGIGLATSPDGITWTDAGGPLIQPAPGANTYWNCVAAHPTIIDRGSVLTVFFKAEQTTTACDGGPQPWGCDQYTGVGQLAVFWNNAAGEYLAVPPNTSPVLNVGQNFGYPRGVYAGGEYKVSLSRRPDMLVASGTISSLSVDGTAWVPGDAPWTQDEVYNPAPVCESTGDFAAFVGGRDLVGTAIDEGYVGRLSSTDFLTWNLDAGPVFSTTVGDVEMRHWDVLPVGTTDYLLYFSDQTGPGGTNRVGLAQTTAGWIPASVQSKVCP